MTRNQSLISIKGLSIYIIFMISFAQYNQDVHFILIIQLYDNGLYSPPNVKRVFTSIILVCLTVISILMACRSIITSLSNDQLRYVPSWSSETLLFFSIRILILLNNMFQIESRPLCLVNKFKIKDTRGFDKGF